MPDEEPPLKRQSAGHYRTRDGRFAVEQNSGRWLVLDTEQTDELGLPLVRGPFASLDESRDAISTARTGPAPRSTLPKRAKGTATAVSHKRGTAADDGPEPEPEAAAETAPEPAPPPLVIRRLEPGDGRVLRRLSEEADAFEVAGKGRRPPIAPHAPLDTIPARRFLAQPDIHLLVAFEGDVPLGFVLAYELLRRHGDPIRLFIYEVGVRAERRREGIGRRLLDELRSLGRERGVASAFVIAEADDRDALAFYRAAGGRRSKGEMTIIRFSTEAD